MIDPGPNLLEQQIETNRLLALIVAAGPAAPGLATLAGGSVPVQWPILFYFSNPSTNPFNIYPDGAGSTGALSTEDLESINASKSLKLTAATGSGRFVIAHIDIPETPTRKVRLQIALANKAVPTGADWLIALSIHDGTNLHRAQIYLKTALAEAFYVNSAGVDVSLGQFAWTDEDYAWAKVDLSVNFATDMYHSVAVNHTSADLSAEGLRPILDALSPRLRLRIELTNNSEIEPSLGFVDQVLVTPELYDIPE